MQTAADPLAHLNLHEHSLHRGAFRSGDVRPLCAVCGELAETAAGCLRCAAPLCSVHGAAAGTERCLGCEQSFELLHRDRRDNPVSRGLLALSFVVGPLAVALVAHLGSEGLFDPYWTLLAAALAAAMPLGIGVYRQRRLRPRFLQERPFARRLELPDVVLDEPTAAPPPSPLAITGFALSVFFFLPLMPIAGVVVGAYALRDVRRDPTLAGRGLAIAGIAIGSIGTLLHLLYLGLLCLA